MELASSLKPLYNSKMSEKKICSVDWGQEYINSTAKLFKKI